MARKKKAEAAPAATDPGPRTQAAIADAVAKFNQRPLRVSVKWQEAPGGFTAYPSHSDGPGHTAQLLSAMGTASRSFMSRNFTALEAATRGRSRERGEEVESINAALALIEAVEPENELEGALAIQMASNHALTMEMLSLAKNTESIQHLALYGNMAVKLQRTFTAQLEALARIRGKGQQTVRVEHVTVAPGAQAIVGDVHHYGRGVGSSSKSEDRSHATEQSSAGQALPSPDPIRQALPVSSSGRPEAVSNARRDESGGPDR